MAISGSQIHNGSRENDLDISTEDLDSSNIGNLKLLKFKQWLAHARMTSKILTRHWHFFRGASQTMAHSKVKVQVHSKA